MEQWPALHSTEQPSAQPAPGQQQVPGQQYPQYQPQQQPHNDNPYASPYKFDQGAAPREEGPQR